MASITVMGDVMDPAETNQEQHQQQTDGQRFYHAQNGYTLLISLSEDDMECRGHLQQKVGESGLTIDALKGYLAADGIREGINEEALQQLINDAENGSSATGLLATGKPPMRGDDGQLLYSVETSEKQASAQDEDEEKRRIDFRAVQQFVNVEPEQEIGRILPPTQGTPGITVKGKHLPGESGKPLLIKLGKNVRSGGDNNDLLFSEIHGRVKFDGETISVDEEYVVDGDVDFSVGNIRFNGVVEVRGDILDGFQVSASKGIKVTGNVGASRLISHGDITFCGMDGQGKGSILCSGSITAHFIHNTTVECWGKMDVDVELRDCNIQCRKEIVTGMLAGGEAIALGGIEAKRIGAPSAVKTKIHAGADYRDLWRLAELYEHLEKVQKSLSSASNMDEAKVLGAEKLKLSNSIIEVRNRKHADANPKVNVKDKLHEGVTILVGNSVEEFNTETSGPISIIENSNEGGLRKLSLTPLQVHASELEKVCLENDEKERLEKEQREAEEREKAAKEALEEQTETTAGENLPQSDLESPEEETEISASEEIIVKDTAEEKKAEP